MKPSYSQRPKNLRKNQSPHKSSPPKQTNHYPFLSDPHRFHYSHPSNPGPGSYEQSHRQRQTSDYHVAREHPKWTIPKEFLWIVAKGREVFGTKNQWKGNIGPGKYGGHDLRGKGHSGWAKKARFNYEEAEAKVDVGPGSYRIGHDWATDNPGAASSAFKSKSTKSYLDEVVQKQIKLHQKQDNPELPFQQVDSETEDNALALKKKHGSPVFLSKIERLPKTETDEVGPGSYTLRSPLGQEKRRRLQTDVAQQQFRLSLMQKHNSSKVISPGPGAYEVGADASKGAQAKRPLLGLILKEGKGMSQSSRDGRQNKYYDTAGKTRGRESKFQSTGRELGSVYGLLREVSRQKHGKGV